MINPLKYILLSSYSFTKRWVNKEHPDRIIPLTIHIFTQIPLSLFLSLFIIVIGSLSFKVEYSFEIFLFLVLIASLSIRWYGKKKFYAWNIENEYKLLSKKQRKYANTFIVFFVFFSLFLFIYLSIIFYGGYDKRFEN
jgi:hypothetical protein